MKALLARLIKGLETGWKKCPNTNHEIFSNTDEYGRLSSCCSVGHTALGLYGSPHKYARVEEEFKSLRVVNPTYERFPRDNFTYVGEIKNQKTISLPVAMSLLVTSKDNGGYNWTTPQVIAWLRTHQND
jgi:hypothetical protein